MTRVFLSFAIPVKPSTTASATKTSVLRIPHQPSPLVLALRVGKLLDLEGKRVAKVGVNLLQILVAGSNLFPEYRR